MRKGRPPGGLARALPRSRSRPLLRPSAWLMRAAIYFLGWALALPGLVFAAALLALGRAIALGNVFRVLWEMLLAFAYGLPLLALVAVALIIAGCFRMGRIVGGTALLIVCLGTIAVILEMVGAPKASARRSTSRRRPPRRRLPRGYCAPKPTTPSPPAG